MQAWYTTRESVLRSFEVAESTRIAPLVDREIQSASGSIDSQLHRQFTVGLSTVAFDWPNAQYAAAWRIYLNDRSFVRIDSIVSGGVQLSPSDYLLYRADGTLDPPFDYIEINRASAAAFSSGLSPQRSVQVSGLAGVVDMTSPGGTLAVGVDDLTPTITVTPQANQMPIGVGSSLVIGDERMQVLERGWATSGSVLLSGMDSKQSANVVEMADTAKVSLYEYLSIGGEFMQVVVITGFSVTVKRAANGSVLCEHESGTPIYVSNSFTVYRGAFGTQAEAHSLSAPVLVQRYPAQVEQLALAEATVAVAQNAGLYARVVGQSGSTREAVGNGLADMRDKTRWAWGRNLRKTAI